MSEYKFYERLRRVMQTSGIDLSSLAAKSGIKYPTLANYRTGKYEPRVSELIQLAAALNVPTSALLPESQQPNFPDDSKISTLAVKIKELEALIPGSTQVYIKHVKNWIETAKENAKNNK